MDLNEYLPMFLAESREHLQELNLAVVRIEEAPDDAETLDEIFRIAHSLKGMSATMGFARIAALTHAMEDVFELLRQRRGGLDRDAIDTLLQCLDALSAAFESIEADGEERLDDAPLVAQLNALIRQQPTEPAPEPESEAGVDDVLARAGGRTVHYVVVTLAGDALMPSVRAFQTIAALADHGEVLASAPAEAAVEQFGGDTIEVWLASDHEADTIQASAAAVPDVASATTTELSAPKAEAAPEAAAAPVRERKSNGAATVRVDAERLDQLMHLMGELVVHRTSAEALAARASEPGLSQAMQDLARSSQALQAMVMQVRMIPVEAVFLRFPRLVRDLSGKLDKRVDLQLSGSETELDRTVVDALGDPLVHLVRNALDHGIEHPADRLAAGKPETATLEISARHAGGNVEISVSDDGRGIDPAAVARKALERGLITPEQVETFDMRAAVDILFAAGFSTATVTSDISGRGVGMDAVRTTIRELGGEVSLTSEQGRGTVAQIRLPLTLAIISTLLVEVGGRPFAIPLDRVERTLRIADHVVRSVAGRQMLVERENVFPLVDAARVFGQPAGESASHAVLVRSHEHRFALAVHELVGQRELVTRPLPPNVADEAAVSGGAVLSDGSIALIVDCDAIPTSLTPHESAARAA
ncbi:MAG TPA: chemotaxis protein CheA [Gaiellaceae bacterium]|nr:chemotaxis protein CheA [Gaiellaceae bacterium]